MEIGAAGHAVSYGHARYRPEVRPARNLPAGAASSRNRGVPIGPAPRNEQGENETAAPPRRKARPLSHVLVDRDMKSTR
ncbi:hypothetical protein AKJ08_0878 [Vulgatibacter incomptus]|uniref:Uncharacterized protein n=1 Tax=Vulgatibacter incomptus TaxID=1391653 RepID=A0A0K1PAQ4_9BACT|nr:hypothetical protein AKJ08_0878 [Vulgatibacter incomptus]